MQEQEGVKVAIFDLDGTLVRSHLWLGLLKHNLQFKKNILWGFLYLIVHMALTPLWLVRLLSKEKYYRFWGEHTSWMIKGLKQNEIEKVFNWLSDNYLLPTVKQTIFERLKNHQKEGFLTILTSGSFEGLLKIIANRLKIDFVVGTRLEIFKEKFTGKIIPPLCFARDKVKRIKYLIQDENLNINFKKSFAYSDSIFDLPLLKLTGLPVVVDPDEELLKIAKNKDWTILKT